tara:strand:- start:25 stop:861 length:837 start_codon:yes stop_codon:yes gene_type:complete
MSQLQKLMLFLDQKSGSEEEISEEEMLASYEQFLLEVTPKLVSLPKLLASFCDIQSFTHSDLMLQILFNYMPSYQSDIQKDDDFFFLHAVDSKLRDKDQHLLNQSLKHTCKQLKSSQRSYNSPILNSLMSVSLLFSGLSDDMGFADTLGDVEKEIGYLPIFQLETFDDDMDDLFTNNNQADLDFATASFTRLITMVLVFFDTSALSKLLDHLTIKGKDNAYDLNNLWMKHSILLKKWFVLSNVDLFLTLNRYMQNNKLIDQKYSLKMNRFSPYISGVS